MSGIPGTEDVSEPNPTKWFISAPRRHQAHAHARTNRETERVELSRGRQHRRGNDDEY